MLKERKERKKEYIDEKDDIEKRRGENRRMVERDRGEEGEGVY